MESPHHRSSPKPQGHRPGQLVLQRAPRHTVLAARPVRLQWPSPHTAGGLAWVRADVLNISTGGLCLALPPELPGEIEQLTHLDLRHLGGFGEGPLAVSVQWSRDHSWIATMGIAFQQQLSAIPQIHGTLLLEG